MTPGRLSLADDMRLIPVEIGSGARLKVDLLCGVDRRSQLAGEAGHDPAPVYCGDGSMIGHGVRIMNWDEAGGVSE